MEQVTVKEKTPKHRDVLIADDTGVEPPLTHYQDIKGEPYGIKFFNLKEQLKVFPQLIEPINIIEDYAKNEIKTKQLQDETKTYKAIVESLKKTLAIDENIKTEALLEKLSTYINVFNRVFKVEKLRKELNGK